MATSTRPSTTTDRTAVPVRLRRLLVMAPDSGDEWPQADIVSATVPDEVVKATLRGL